jgi:hypothetical protein
MFMNPNRTVKGAFSLHDLSPFQENLFHKVMSFVGNMVRDAKTAIMFFRFDPKHARRMWLYAFNESGGKGC